MPELTVSIPAYNHGRYIKKTIESVLSNTDLDLKIIVIDDASDDNTTEVVKSIDDPRIELVVNKKRKGLAYCHNLVVEESSSPFITVVRQGDLVLPGAFKKLVEKISTDPKIAQISCFAFHVNENGFATWDAFREARLRASKRKLEKISQNELLIRGFSYTHLLTYRREVFHEIGKFNEALRTGFEYEIALRIIEKFDLYILPEVLCASRVERFGKMESMKPRDLEATVKRLLISRELYKTNKIKFINEEKFSKLVFLTLWHYSRLPTFSKKLARIPHDLRQYFMSKIYAPTSYRLYCGGVGILSRWVNYFLINKKLNTTLKEKRIAYHLRNFPVLSQTFVQREIKALKDSGLNVQVFADNLENLESLDRVGTELAEMTCYLDPMDSKSLSNYKKLFFLKNPFLYLALFLYVVLSRYSKYKSYKTDLSVFSRSIYLAGTLKRNGITHIHSPWANMAAFVSLIASRLLGIPFTVQARAYDIYQIENFYLLRPILENAEFVITNTACNESYLKSLSDCNIDGGIYKIYNGIDLKQFNPRRSDEKSLEHVRFLTVARLTEQKGLVYLLKAFRILKDKGYQSKCEIIGPAVHTNHYIKLKILHKKLELEDCVFFLGAQSFESVMRQYEGADIVVLPCIIAEDGSRDIIPNTLIEAMAMKLPVISTNITGIPEIIENGVDGLLVSPEDEYALVGAMIKLINDPDLRKELGANARKKVAERFNINKNISCYLKLFGEESG